MAKKPRPKAKEPLEEQLPPDARKILEGFIADILYNIMAAMLKADSVAPKIPGIQEAARTEDQMRRIASLAANYYMKRANPSPTKLSEEQVEALKRESLEFALKQL
jgi:hypothetical protein